MFFIDPVYASEWWCIMLFQNFDDVWYMRIMWAEATLTHIMWILKTVLRFHTSAHQAKLKGKGILGSCHWRCLPQILLALLTTLYSIRFLAVYNSDHCILLFWSLISMIILQRCSWTFRLKECAFLLLLRRIWYWCNIICSWGSQECLEGLARQLFGTVGLNWIFICIAIIWRLQSITCLDDAKHFEPIHLPC